MVSKLLKRVPQIRAAEYIAAVTQMTLGAGRVESSEADRIMRGWERQADAVTPRQIETATPDALAEMGVAVIKRPKKDPTP